MDNKVLEKTYPMVLGALTTLIAQFVVRRMWQVATGSTPPDPNDPEVPVREAVTWFVASSLGVGVAQLLVGRYSTRKVRQWVSDKQLG
ncbi:MAG: DUF4235 domain-containing protein [Actinomycetia bacterium]|nr:DUF4235 domain-containing protein [Actinomycetes bacterium]